MSDNSDSPRGAKSRVKPSAPSTMPPRNARFTAASREDFEEVTVRLAVVTPIFGGAAVPRTIDEVDVIRAPTIRGHLRFWWRALDSGPRDSKQLAARERAFWGGAAQQGEDTGRSSIEISVLDVKPAAIDRRQVDLNSLGSYALWPARGQKGGAAAPRRNPGTTFTLQIRAPSSKVQTLRHALTAWILFGGYGGRTRRGCGALTVQGDAQERARWLPQDATLAELQRVLGVSAFRGKAVSANDTPSLAGALLVVGDSRPDALNAWSAALTWLKEFRQQEAPPGPAHDREYAREHGSTEERPGRSTWPEADKIRHASRAAHRKGQDWWHEPRHNAVGAFPRAGFGLPIIGQFQGKLRGGTPIDRNELFEPGPYTLTWRDSRRNVRQRLASVLVLRPLPLADGHFMPAGLWFHRAFPRGEVVACDGDLRRPPILAAPFDLLVAPGDVALYAPLARGSTAPAGERLRSAFFGWLNRSRRAREVT